MKQLPSARLFKGIVLAMVLVLAGATDVLAQRSRTSSSRGSTKVERRTETRKKATPARSSSRSTGRVQSRGTSGRTGSAAKGRVERRSSPAASRGEGRTGSVSTRARQDARRSGTTTRSREDERRSGASTRSRQDAGRSGATTRSRQDVSRSGATTRSRQDASRSGAATRSRQDESRATGRTDSRTGSAGTAARGRTTTRGGAVTRGETPSRDGSVTRGGSTSRGGAVTRGGANRGGSATRGGAVRGPRNGPDVRGGVRIEGRRSRLQRDGRVVRIPTRKWNYRRHHYPQYRHYTPTYWRAYRPNIHVHVTWPWVIRYERHWRPRYRYRQVVYVETVVNGRRNRAEVEVETVYSHRLIYANDNFAEVDVEIERLEIYQGGRYLGAVDRIPTALSQMTATVYRNGDVFFDRETFLLGDTYSGLELLSTQAYDGYVLDAYHHRDGYRVGQVDLRRGRVVEKRSSRLFRPDRVDGHVPISLLPNDEGWLWDYGADAISAAVDDYDWYYGGSGARAPGVDPYRQEDAWDYTAQSGVDIRFRRESQIQRVQ